MVIFSTPKAWDHTLTLTTLHVLHHNPNLANVNFCKIWLNNFLFSIFLPPLVAWFRVFCCQSVFPTCFQCFLLMSLQLCIYFSSIGGIVSFLLFFVCCKIIFQTSYKRRQRKKIFTSTKFHQEVKHT